jgi:hypothetical protein
MKPIFSRNIDIDKMAFLNWRIEKDDHIVNLLNIADGFLLSSIELANHCLTNNNDKRADILIFPILTNANHSFELYLKALNWTLNELLDIDKRIEGRHNLKQIYQTVKAKFKNYKGNISYQDFTTATKELENYIEELFDKIQATPKNDKMDFSRYSLDNNYDDHFYVTDFGTVEIDLENLVERFQKIKDSLEQLTDFLYHNELRQNW